MMWIWVALGSAIGGVLRYYMGAAIWLATGAKFPWGTFCVNVLGSFAIGILAVLITQRMSGAWPAREFLIVGVLGGFTTFSGFSYESLGLLQASHYAQALGYIGGSVVVCIAATAMGAWAATRLL
jgi:fluoride exporter